MRDRIVCGCLIVLLMLSVTACSDNVNQLFIKHEKYEVQTSSMKPTFFPGDIVIFEEVNDPSELRAGDIILFWTTIDGQRVKHAHRIVEIYQICDSLAFSTKGDNNPMVDAQYVHQKDVLGKFVKIRSTRGRVYG